MILLPNRFPGRIPSRTHRTTVAAETSSSLATCFVVMYLFVMFVNLTTAIYTRCDFAASGAACELPVLRSWLVAVARMFPFREMFPFVFPFLRNAKPCGFKGFQRCFQCFHIFRRVLKENVKTTLNVRWENSLKNMETLETFP